MTARPLKVLVSTLSPSSSAPLLSVASALVQSGDGEGFVLGVVEVPEDRSLSESALLVQRRRRSLRRATQAADAAEFGVEVRATHSLEAGVCEAVHDLEADLLLLPWRPAGRAVAVGAVERLLADPPCDVAAVRAGRNADIKSVLLPVRGGPHAQLALRLAQAVAASHEATLTLLHVRLTSWDAVRREREEQFFQAVRQQLCYRKVEEVEVEAQAVGEALLEQAARHDLVVMGAAARDRRSSYLLGQIPELVAARAHSTTIVVKTKEPVTPSTFGLTVPALVAPEHQDISELVDSWFAENTFHSHEFRNLSHLVALKERQGLSISLALPTLNEEKTVGKIISTIKKALLERYPLLDELVVIDSNSEDRTVDIAESLGVPVYSHPEILPQHGSYQGKGEALWKSLFVTKGDIVVWIDSDITGIHPKFVYGLLGPLLTQPRLGFVKGFYRRPLNLGGQMLTAGGGRVTELTARPLINLFYPALSGLVQPLAGEMAGRREVLEAVPFFTGYGVETGLLIDILQRFGLRSLAQADLEYRVHRNQTLLSLSKMAFAIVQVVLRRLEDEGRLELRDELSTSMKLIRYSPTELFLEVKEIREHQRPPIDSLLEYRVRATDRDVLVVDGV